MSGRWAARLRSITAYLDTVDTFDTVTDRTAPATASVSTVSIVSPYEKAGAELAERHSVNTVNSVTSGETNIEADERDALMNEDRYATHQSIEQATMLAGLLKVATYR